VASHEILYVAVMVVVVVVEGMMGGIGGTDGGDFAPHSRRWLLRFAHNPRPRTWLARRVIDGQFDDA